MGGHFKTAHIALGDAILERLSDGKVPSEVKGALGAFKAAHKALSDAHQTAQEAETSRDAGLAAVSSADTKLDRLIDRLAALLPAHGLGERRNPFAAYSTLTPSDLQGIAFAKEAVEATRIAKAIKKTKPHKDVLKACDDVVAGSKTVQDAIRGVTAPQRAYASALGKRDALLPEWNVLRARLERRAIGAWADEPEMVRAFFAPVSALAAPVTKRAKKEKPAPDGAPPKS